MTTPQQPHGPLRSFGRIKARPIKARQAALFDSLLPSISLPQTPFNPLTLMAEAKAIWAIRPGIAGMTEKVPAVAKGCNVEKPCDKGATFPYSEVSDKPARGPIKK